MAQDNSTGSSDPFTAMWGEWMKHMMAAGVSPPALSADAQDGMRRVFFDVLASQTDQFMRSEAFLKSMKQGTDNAIALQKAVNEYMQRALSAAQIPSRADAEHLVALVRGMEDRLVAKLDDLQVRVGHLEKKPRK